jgi:ubiquinone/menaquinone biosynthesis C-methylase UbiE
MTTTAVTDDPAAPPLPQQAGRLLGQVAGYVGYRTIAIGLRRGLIAALADAGGPATADELADRLGLDPFYTAVWCRAALATGLCDPAGGGRGNDPGAEPGAGSGAEPVAGAALGAGCRLAPHVATLLLDTSHSGYLGGVFDVLGRPEVFDRFESTLASGQRMWWDACSPEWITGVAATGLPYYTRLAPGGLDRVPELANRLRSGGRIVDTACGSGHGLIHLARAYPNCSIVGVDGDGHSIDQARDAVADAGLSQRIRLLHAPLEEFTLDDPAACVINNISLHECRDIDRVTANVAAVLEPGGWFVISDFPFPDTVPGLRSVPGQVMSGVQFFEAQIDDQLLPRAAYDGLLARHGFTAIGHADLTPVHALTFGRRAGGTPIPHE